MRRVAAVLLCALAWAAPPSPAAEETSSFEACEAHAHEQQNFRCFGLIAGRTGAWVEARDRLRRYLDDHPDNPLAWWALGYVAENVGDANAAGAYLEAARLFREREEPDGETQVLLYLQELLWKLGEFEASLEVLDRGVQAAARSTRPMLRVHARTAQAVAAGRLGRHGEAERRLLQVEGSLNDAPGWLRSLWLATRAANLQAQDRRQESIDVYRQAARLRSSEGNHFWEAYDRLSVAKLLSNSEQLQAFRIALDVARRGGNRVVEAQALLALGDLDEDTARGRLQMHRAIEMLREGAPLSALQPATLAMAMHLARREPRRNDEADVWYREALTQARQSGSYNRVASVEATRNHDLWEVAGSDDLARDAALQHALVTLDAVEAVRDLQLDPLIRARSFAAWRLTYQKVVGRLLQPLVEGGEPDIAAAFRILERMRGRVLLDELDGAQVRTSRGGPLAEERIELLRGIARVQGRLLRDDLSGEVRERLMASLGDLELRESEVRARLAETDADFATIRGYRPIDLGDVQALLQTDEALITFQLARGWTGSADFAGGAWLILVTRTSHAAYPIGNPDDLDDAIDVYRALIAGRRPLPDEASIRLHDLTLKAALADLPANVRRLVVVPDGSLHDLPFGSLRASRGDLPLALRYELTFAPSATVWARWRSGTRVAGDAPLLAFADPALDVPEDAADGPPATRGSLDGRTSLRRLPFAVKEGRHAVRRLGGRSRLFQGDEATETRLKRADLARFDVVHLAAHALVDYEHPQRSGILLAADGDDDDGLLQIHEIAELDLPGRLVVLSACQSASGERIAGEGVMNLGRGFFVAGAHAVIGSLWPLRDDEAHAFFGAFYTALAEGDSARAALRRAQQDRLDAGAPEAAWAGIVLIGDGDLTPFPGGRTSSRDWPAWAAGGLALLIGAAWLLYRWSPAASRTFPTA